ncbi:MAG: response regulator [Spirochaetaceae bacterium]
MFEGQDRTVLLVEDEAIIALNEKATLEKRGLHVQLAHTGDKAIQAAETCESIDVVLMDIDLGDGMDGTEVASRILEHRKLPIVFLTSHAEQEMVRKVKGITRYGYVLKNAGEFVLVEAIQTALELFDAHTRLEKSERKYRTMIDTAPMPFQSLDEEGRLIDVNRAWLETLGYGREEILGTWFGDLLSPDQVELFRERFPIFKARGHIEKVNFSLRRSDGSFVHTLFNGCIAYQEDGAFSHTVCVFQVVSPSNGEA